MRRSSKPISRNTGSLRKVSARHASELAEYSRLRAAFLEEHPRCAVFPERRATEIHHTRGRGRFLNDVSTWMAVSRAGHEKIERERAWARERGYLVYGKDGK